MTSERDRAHHVRQGSANYRKSNESMWVFAYHAAKIVGKYERGATLGMASDLNVSVDTIENNAHAYQMFAELCAYDGGKFRHLVASARRAPYIYLSHFRALYEAKRDYGIGTHEVLEMLFDIIQGEGSISSRSVDVHARTKFGDTRTWQFYAGKAQRELSELLKQPDLPREVRDQVKDTFTLLGEKRR